MVGYTKQDYDSLYSLKVGFTDEVGNTIRHPIKLHYHRAVMESYVHHPWPTLVEELGITSDDKVIVVGAGYGWGAEKLLELTGCSIVATDISTYIQETQDDSEESEIISCIRESGFDERFGLGKEVFEALNAKTSYKATMFIHN